MGFRKRPGKSSRVMKILIDESLPRYLKRVLTDHDAKTVQEMGWAGISNGELLKLAEDDFEIFLTADKNIRYQQNLKDRKLAIVEFPSNRLSIVKRLESDLKTALEQITTGAYVTLDWP
jgi:predicted nuclease of predicted toxin-antitoxin system